MSKDLILIGYEWLTVFVPCWITYKLLNAYDKKLNSERIRSKFLPVIIFAVYFFGVFFVTGTGTLFHILQFGIEITAGQINLTPFSSSKIDLLGYFLNIVLFIPLGFLIPVIWPNLNKLRYIVISGFSLSLLIEISQLLNQRRTDIDDLLLNTAGAIIGYLIFKLIAHISKHFNHTSTDKNDEMVIYILAMFIGHFLLFNEFGIAKILYGF